MSTTASARTRRTRLLTAAATVALTALSLTACNDGSGVRDEGASERPTSSDTAAGKPKPAATATPATTKPRPTAPATTKPKPTTPTTSGRVTCNGSTVKVTAQTVTRPLNHLLLTVTNTGSKTCDLYGYPAVRFGEAQAVPPVIEESKPQAVVSLAPGQSGYAGVALSGGDDGSGANGRTEKTLQVFFQGRNTNDGGPGATAALPAKGVYVDDSLKVTYWQQEQATALTW